MRARSGKLSSSIPISIFDNQIFTEKNQIWSLCNQMLTFFEGSFLVVHFGAEGIFLVQSDQI